MGAPPPGSEQPAGLLGRGTPFANSMQTTFKLIAYSLPIVGGILGDTKLGRFKAIVWGSVIAVAAHIFQVVAVVPPTLGLDDKFNVPTGLFLVSLILMAIGAGK